MTNATSTPPTVPTILDLYMTDPLKLTKDNLDTIIDDMRERRKKFKLTGITSSGKKPAAPKLTKAQATAVATVGAVDVGDL